MDDFRIGDTVWVKDHPKGVFIFSEMKHSLNKMAIIKQAYQDDYLLDDGWFWKAVNLTLVYPRTATITTTKKYQDNCPCGIHHSVCAYHKD